MKIVVLAAAILALGAVAAEAGSRAAQPHASVLVGPDQPIPYGRVKAYSAASPKARIAKDWWAGAYAPTGNSTDASAIASSTPIDSPMPSAANPGVSSRRPDGAAASAVTPPSASSASTSSRR